MNLDPVIARFDGVFARPVDSVAALAALGDRPPAFLPAVFVVPDGEQAATPRAVTGIHDQDIACTFVVVLMVSATAADPNAAAAELKALTAIVEGRLVGWVHPDAEGSATAHAGSALLGITEGRIEWAIRFRTRRRLRVAVTS